MANGGQKPKPPQPQPQPKPGGEKPAGQGK